MVREGDSGTVLVVSDRISHCRFFVEKLQAAWGEGRAAVRPNRSEERSAIVAAVQGGEIEVLVATLQLIGEGFDCPGLSTLFLTTPISFDGRLLQVIGRIMRPAANKQARVFDYIDENIRRSHALGSARDLVLSQL